MKPFVLLLATVAALPVQAATFISGADYDAAYVEDFEDTPTGEILDTDAVFQALGMDQLLVQGKSDEYGARAGVGRALGATTENDLAILDPGQSGSIVALYIGFSSEISRFGFEFSDQQTSFTVDFLNGGSVFDTIDASTPDAELHAFDFETASGFDAVNITGLDGVLIDSFRVETLAPVPLPAALPLGLAGLGALLLVGRRRRAAVRA
ncbi:hypothetical protein [Salipiger mucosus]|uniref:VPLPA-CTERM protein sorting domain-containing protein n=1 Tax=Salipiger mucosus DSM 16094 TaxID=1123237 RepID=S9S7D9_9RHOB|nr:hypothetical protein [Salipiger mucosus]EPX82114.1 hypothetical protein Salmuc_02482 [Salipiger mucosus DSM 16094]